MDGQKLKQALTLVLGCTKSDVVIQRFSDTVYVGASGLRSHAIVSFADKGDDVKVVITETSARDIVKQIRKSKKVEVLYDDEHVVSSFVMDDKNNFSYASMDLDSKTLKGMTMHLTKDTAFKTSGTLLGNALALVLNFAPKDAGDVRFTGCHLTVKDNTVELMSTDNQAVAIYKFRCTDSTEAKTILPKEASSFAKLMFGELEVGIKPGFFFFKGTDGDFSSIVVLQTFYQDDDSTPLLPYQRAIVEPFVSNEPEYRFSIGAEELKESMEDVLPFTNPIHKDAYVRLEGGKFSVTSSTETNKGYTESDKLNYPYTEVRTLRLGIPAMLKIINNYKGDYIEVVVYNNRYLIKNGEGLDVYGTIMLSS